MCRLLYFWWVRPSRVTDCTVNVQNVTVCLVCWCRVLVCSVNVQIVRVGLDLTEKGARMYSKCENCYSLLVLTVRLKDRTVKVQLVIFFLGSTLQGTSLNCKCADC
jgi:hypothetical protein